jgi:spore coat polysaccharide biosynthesis predicted glycosyltransferase SpsG
LTYELIDVIKQDENHADNFGHFNLDMDELLRTDVISRATFQAVKGARAVYFNKTEDDNDILSRHVQLIVDSYQAAADDLKKAKDKWQAEHPQL